MELLRLGPKDRELLEQTIRMRFDRTNNGHTAKRLIDLSGRLPVSKTFKNELYSDFKIEDYVI